jgi:hypothetical protein
MERFLPEQCQIKTTRYQLVPFKQNSSNLTNSTKQINHSGYTKTKLINSIQNQLVVFLLFPSTISVLTLS